MKTVNTIIILFLFVSISDCLGQDYQWAYNIDGTFRPYSRADNNGNVYMTGQFSGVVDFDLQTGVSNKTHTPGSVNDLYLVKYNTDRSLAWIHQMGGSGSGSGQAIAIDGSGNVYITGWFKGTINFGGGNLSTSTVNTVETFFAKYNSSGGHIWSHRIAGSSGGDQGNTIELDNTEAHIYIGGYFARTADFDPGAGTANLVSNSNSFDGYIAKYTTGGVYQWASKTGSSGSDFAFDLDVDASGNPYLCGRQLGDGFFSKYNTSGTLLWTKTISSGGFNNTIKGITIDKSSGSIYITGDFHQTTDFDPNGGVANLTTTGENGFLARYSSTGSYLWVTDFGIGKTYASAINGSGEIHVIGKFNNTIDFDPGPGVANLTSAGGGDLFLAKYDASQNYIWAMREGSSTGDLSVDGSVSLDNSDNVYISGDFSGTSDFDPGPGIANLTSSSSLEDFLAKYGPNILPIELASFSATWKDHSFDEVKLNWQTLSEKNNDSFIIERSNNGQDFIEILQVPGAGDSFEPINYQELDIDPIKNTVSYYRLKQRDYNGKYFISSPVLLTPITSNVSLDIQLLYPNPVIDLLNYIIYSSKKTDINIAIINNLGQQVQYEHEELQEGNNKLSILLDRLSEGEYIIQVETVDGKNQVARRFIIQEK